MGDTGDIMIDVKDLHKSFGHNTVLNGVDISIRRGEKIAVIGPSGSGSCFPSRINRRRIPLTNPAALFLWEFLFSILIYSTI